MVALAALVDDGHAALRAQDHGRFAECMRRNFEIRCAIMDVSDFDLGMVEIAARHGATAKLSGSGGAVIGVLPEPVRFDGLAAELAAYGARSLRPRLVS